MTSKTKNGGMAQPPTEEPPAIDKLRKLMQRELDEVNNSRRSNPYPDPYANQPIALPSTTTTGYSNGTSISVGRSAGPISGIIAGSSSFTPATGVNPPANTSRVNKRPMEPELYEAMLVIRAQNDEGTTTIDTIYREFDRLKYYSGPLLDNNVDHVDRICKEVAEEYAARSVNVVYIHCISVTRKLEFQDRKVTNRTIHRMY